jgi:hypothetical protein
MATTFMRTLVVGAVLNLAFPPGWCCAALAAEAPAPAPQQEESRRKCCCCEDEPKGQAPTPAPHPAPPPCCCHREAPIPPERVLPDEMGVPAALLAPVFGADLPTVSHPAAGDLPPPALAPPLNVLLCVWLC